ncbi:MAG: hypothetical protein J6K58_07040 [Lachnospiraceae bacterium]|nr:hypothetical protein [Lachnospiraceae bacterium]MBP3458948.1 hypothetical protein [Lachnospiraceae bacterium]
MKERTKRKEIRWAKLDNTANLFPVIATESMTNVYRISVTLTEEIDKELLQEALVRILPWFDSMNVRMRTGVFWYYFETNRKGAPLVTEENDYPCRYIEPHTNRNYLFRVTYYKCRINLEVFHVLADGMGGVTFLKELTYQYLRLKYPSLCKVTGDELSDTTSLNTEDSYLKNYKKSQPRGYKSEPAVHIKGEKLRTGALGVIHGYMSVEQLRQVSRERGISINEYLASVYTYSIYKEYLHGAVSKKPVVTCIPVNLRPYFESLTTRNFFAMVSAVFHPEKEEYTLEEVTEIVVKSLREQINKEHLEKLFSYNVSNQKNLVLRAVPLLIKKIAMRWVYYSSAKATTTTMTNIGAMQVDEPYQPYIRRFCAMLSVSAGQNVKGTICSYKDELVFTFSSILRDASIQRRFFKTLVQDGIDVTIESNGVYYE